MWYYIVDNDISCIIKLSGSVRVPLHIPGPATPRQRPVYPTSTEVIFESLSTPLPSLCLLSVDAKWEYWRVPELDNDPTATW